MNNTIEELLYSAHEHGKREEMLNVLKKIRQENPNTELVDLYNMSYEKIMNTN